jgi:DNA-binding NarL/FixJ family response regulator
VTPVRTTPEQAPGAASGTPIRVFVVDEQRLLVEALPRSLGGEAAVRVVGTEVALDRVPDAIRPTPPDVLLLVAPAIALPLAAGVAALHRAFPRLPILVAAPAAADATVGALALAGAAGHVATDRGTAELVAAIARVAAGETLFPSALLVGLLRRRSAPEADRLSPREVEVLAALTAGETIEDAAGRLGLSVHTVRSHLRNAMARLGASSRLEAVLVAIRSGLVRPPGRP